MLKLTIPRTMMHGQQTFKYCLCEPHNPDSNDFFYNWRCLYIENYNMYIFHINDLEYIVKKFIRENGNITNLKAYMIEIKQIEDKIEIYPNYESQIEISTDS